MIHNARIDIRISNPEKEAWVAYASARGMDLTQMIKQAVRTAVADSQANVPYLTTSSGSGTSVTWTKPLSPLDPPE